MTPPVTQAARDAAADLMVSQFTEIAGLENEARWADDMIRPGHDDTHPFVQAFAKAIAEERERAARIADEFENDRNSRAHEKRQAGQDDSFHAACASAASRIATAIRATEVGNG